jgi:hypothetical protein
MLRLPYENYIRFLITQGFDYDDTISDLRELELETCSEEYWNQQFEILENSMLPNKVKRCWTDPSKKKPGTYNKHMSAIGLGEISAHKESPTALMNMVMDMIEDPDVRLVVDSLLMRKSAYEEVIAVIQAKFGMNIRPLHVKTYENLFFSVKIMSRKSWRNYIKMLEGFRKKVLYLAFSGQDMDMRSLLKLPTKISVSEHYQQLHIQALEKFKSLMASNVPKSEAMALKWAQLAMSAGDKYEKLKLGDASDFGKDLQMEFEYVESDFPGIGEDDLEQINANIDIGEAKENHEPIPLTANPIKQL